MREKFATPNAFGADTALKIAIPATAKKCPKNSLIFFLHIISPPFIFIQSDLKRSQQTNQNKPKQNQKSPPAMNIKTNICAAKLSPRMFVTQTLNARKLGAGPAAALGNQPRRGFALAFTAIALALLGLAGTAHAQQTISLDFSGAGNPIPSATPAGVVPTTNWNNLSTTSGTLAAGSVKDNTGAAVSGLSANWGSNGSATTYGFVSTSFPNPGDNNLFSSSQLTFGSFPDGTQPWHFTMSLTGIPYSSYDVYVYSEGLLNAQALVNINGTWTGNAPVGGQSTYFSHMGSPYASYVQADPLETTYTGHSPNANYVLFSGVTGSNLTIHAQENGGNGGFVGVEIVAVPEPSTYAMALGGFGMLFVLQRMRRKSRAV